MKVELKKVFKEDYYDEILNDIYYREFKEGISDLKETLEVRSGWYLYYNISFKYKGLSYLFVVKEHSSDNVSDFEILQDTFRVLENSENEGAEEIDYEAELKKKDKVIEELSKVIQKGKKEREALEESFKASPKLEMDRYAFEAAANMIITMAEYIDKSRIDEPGVEELTGNLRKIFNFLENNLSK